MPSVCSVFCVPDDESCGSSVNRHGRPPLCVGYTDTFRGRCNESMTAPGLAFVLAGVLSVAL